MFWLFPQWKDSATSDATLLLGCEMEFHFYSLAPSQSRVSDKIHFRSAAQEVICSSASTSVTGNAADCGKPIKKKLTFINASLGHNYKSEVLTASSDGLFLTSSSV